MSRAAILFVLAMLAGCVQLPPPDQPAHPYRVGRFIGLISNCGCSDVTQSRMLAEYPQAVSGTYTPAEIKTMRGYVAAALEESYDNQIEICAETCAQACMVNTIVQPLGGRIVAGAGTCPITERDLHLTFGRFSDGNLLIR